MFQPNLQILLQMKSLINEKSDFSSREVVDNFLLSYFSLLSDPNFPALEIGVYEGASACYLCEALELQNRQATLLDNFHFLKNEQQKKIFISDVIKKNLSNVGVDPDKQIILDADSLTHDWKDQKFSFFHIDAHNPAHDINTALRISNVSSIIAIDDFLVVPCHLEVVIKAIQNQELFPFAIATKKIWLSNDKNFAREINDNKEIWQPLDEILRIEEFNFFGYPIHKIYSSKKYHQKMYNYFK